MGRYGVIDANSNDQLIFDYPLLPHIGYLCRARRGSPLLAPDAAEAQRSYARARIRQDRRWSVNGRFLTRNPTGVDRYAQEILRAMDALICEGHPLTAGLTLDILCPAGSVEASPFVNIPLRLLPSAPGHFWEQFILPGYVRGGLLSLCNTGPLALKRQIVCIHDLNSRITPESYGLMFRAVYRVLVPALGRRAAQIVTVSRFSQKTMGRFDIKPAR